MSIPWSLMRKLMPILATTKAYLRLVGKESIILRQHSFFQSIDSAAWEEHMPWVTATVLFAAFGYEKDGVETVYELLLGTAVVGLC